MQQLKYHRFGQMLSLLDTVQEQIQLHFLAMEWPVHSRLPLLTVQVRAKTRSLRKKLRLRVQLPPPLAWKDQIPRLLQQRPQATHPLDAFPCH